MDKIMRELYYMIDDWAGQQYANDEEAKILLERQSDLKKKIADRLGEDGQDLIDALSELNLCLEDIHDKALFQAALRFGAEIRGAALS